MITISMFNNKGGVGKTTLTCNLGNFLADYHSKRVLIVDCDPQCNATQLIMGSDFASDLYWDNSSNNYSEITTISDILQPIEDGDSSILETIVPINKSTNRFNVDLIPGHPTFSIIEDRLGSAWHELKGGDLGGIRKTNWNTSLVAQLNNQYDFIFFDLGPSLGSINRSILIGCQYFITPMGTDIFSILGVRNISSWLSSWMGIYTNSLALTENRTPGRLNQYQIAAEPAISKGYLGYTSQQYITKSKEGVRRPTKAFEEIINMIPEEIANSLQFFMPDNLNSDSLKIGDVKHLYSLIPLAQSVSSPILKLKSSDGLVGTQFKQQSEYEEIISAITENILKNLNLAE
ncbi:ParA family protein [Belliella aquatica]|uniref:Phage-related regulatory protein n=1 Tax=Belliella aquatica TaxID=1323734 RepID=A0ABQ1N3U5_9BACT|nr:ParA family protein [Belliella aquatica]MCH7407418.1 ParA family protein [Belliella aquatica]GGC53098.1 phage-related regulatory protein [Belliella aquatica]